MNIIIDIVVCSNKINTNKEMTSKTEIFKTMLDDTERFNDNQLILFYKEHRKSIDLSLEYIIKHCLFYSSRRSFIVLLCEENLDYDVHQHNDYLFWCACNFGCLELAKYLFEVRGGVNLHAINGGAFAESIVGNHLNIFEWLITYKEQIDFNLSRQYIYDTYHLNSEKCETYLDKYDCLIYSPIVCDDGAVEPLNI